MKTLSKFVVRVNSQAQLNVALKFFLRSSRRELNRSSIRSFSGFRTLYVGMLGRTVNVGSLKFDHETVIDFNDMALLADTPTRYRALDASGFKPEPRKETKKALPIVQFDYPKSDTFVRTRRSVRLIQATPRYYVGVEILPDNKFQFKKFLKNKATNVEVLTF
jgi:hypothetical protein